MNRRMLCGLFVSSVVILSMTAVPASSMASGSSKSPMGVTPIYEGLKAIREPLLPKWAAKADTNIEHGYFRQLVRIVSGMCKNAEAEGAGRTITKYWPEMIQFNAIRQPLNNLLNRYALGFAPGIEDFSKVTNVNYVLLKKQKINGHPYRLERITEINSVCTYKLG